MEDPSISLPLAPRYADLKKEIARLYPDFEVNATKAWGEIIEELGKVTAVIKNEKSDYIPQVHFADLEKLSQDELDNIKRKGCVVIKGIVDEEEARKWKESLEEFIKANPDVEGFPVDNKQFFELYWTKPQVAARAHPNLLASTVWLNNLYSNKTGQELNGVDLSTPLTYADRFRIRPPGGIWRVFPPHIDGGTIERWEDPVFRKCFEDIFTGDWRKHDPCELSARLDANTSLYGRPNQCSVFRTFQGWLSISDTGPQQGTLTVFPDVLLSNSYITLRPFFRPTVPINSPEIFKAENWEFDLSSSQFPGIHPRDGGYVGPKPTPEQHPHLLLGSTMTSMPFVKPGDAAFWYCDVIHGVEMEHTGPGDSAVMYIPAVPLTPQNLDYVERQRQKFEQGQQRPPDFPKAPAEDKFVGIATAEDIFGSIGKRAMGFPVPTM
ncbi:hypothetical protein AX16_002205 [Volvariella volvacea WC 439]|nr:hypothetical protein AX16_002205 [Volvariella volvacea WC 439]